MEFPPVLRAAAIVAVLVLGVITPPARGDSVLMAAGDISCPGFSGCHQKGTSDILVAQRSSLEGLAAVLTLGDNQYDNGKLWEFQRYFDPTWGRVKSLIHPVPGNHDWQSGYYDYFGAAAGPRGKGWYSFDIGTWHLIALNSCYGVSCSKGSEQERWLKADLAAHPAACTLAYWHDAPAVSGAMQPFADDLDAAGADVILGGHDHNWRKWSYKGLRVFTVGTGGESGPSTWGVIKIVLRPFGYSWRFVPEGGKSSSEAGEGVCRGSQLGAPHAGGADEGSAASDDGRTTGGDPAPAGGFQVVAAASADGRVKSDSPNRSYGDDDTLEVELPSKPKDPARRSYLKFDVSGIAGTVNSATLRLWAAGDASDGGDVFLVDGGWTESSLTWASAPVVGAAPIGHAGRVKRGTVDVALDPSAFTRDGTYAVALAGGDAKGAQYSSREDGQPAQLILRGVPPVPTPPPPEPPASALRDPALRREAAPPAPHARRRPCVRPRRTDRKRAARHPVKKRRRRAAAAANGRAVQRSSAAARGRAHKHPLRHCARPKRGRPAGRVPKARRHVTRRRR